MSTTALVLGGGGLTGIGWEIGFLAGMADQGIDLCNADIVVGTSAGSLVGAAITSGANIRELYRRALVPAPRGSDEERAHGEYSLAVRDLLRAMPRAWRGRKGTPSERLQLVGAEAMRARPNIDNERVRVVAQALPGPEWPQDRDLRVVVTDVTEGRVTTFDRHGPADLEHAVAASCAAPFFFPPVRIGDHDYVDGGTTSVVNVEFAAEADVMIVLAPLPFRTPGSKVSLRQELQRLRPGVHSLLVSPTRGHRRLVRRKLMNPDNRGPAARAGFADSYAWRDAVAALWPR